MGENEDCRNLRKFGLLDKARSPSVYIVSVFINTQHGSVIRAGFCSMHMLMHMQKLSSEVVLTFVKVIVVGSS